MIDTLWTNVTAVTLEGDSGYGMIGNAVIGCREGKIVYVGPEQSLPARVDAKASIFDGGGKLVTPALIDCHTHLVYGGDRADEFESRLSGASYADIAAAGGGIRKTVALTRAMSEDALYDLTLDRFKTLWRNGVAALEIKSGYGLDLESERKQLRVATRLAQDLGIAVQRTCLAAHAVPPEFASDRQAYIDLVCRDILPTLAAEGLVDAVDAFCDHVAFSAAEVEQVFTAAQALGLSVKIHAEQLSNSHGAALAARFGALSADHLEYLDDAGAAAMAAAGMTATLLPGAYYYLKETQRPPVDLLRRHGVPMALATDHNPGTSPILSMQTVMNMGCLLFGLTVEESLRGVTVNAARALGWQKTRGRLLPGYDAAIAFWDAAHPRDLVYTLGQNLCRGIYLDDTYYWFDDGAAA